MKFLLAIALVVYAVTASAEDKLITIDTRPNTSVAFYYMKNARASATVVLLPGGAGDIHMKDGVPHSNNFLVRTRAYFAAQGFNVAVVNRPSDKTELGYEFRHSDKHVDDLRRVVAYVKRDTRLPVWLIGTSRGTVSATAAAIAFGNDELAGIVLTASVTSSEKPGAVPTQDLSAIRIPVLVLHHRQDACNVCQPDEVELITSGLTHAPIKKQIMVDGGAEPQGNPCESMHWHGFVGLEKQVVAIIADWIKHPAGAREQRPQSGAVIPFPSASGTADVATRSVPRATRKRA